MKIYEVTWSVPCLINAYVSGTIYMKKKSKRFSTEDRANNLLKSIKEASYLLGVDVECKVEELEIE